ncbi:hypothetical protein H101_06418 [Trichophyton interdigitale H6]|nr:hypothetical protein H101_06418 [Trichophyton interdigitale H6]
MQRPMAPGEPCSPSCFPLLGRLCLFTWMETSTAVAPMSSSVTPDGSGRVTEAEEKRRGGSGSLRLYPATHHCSLKRNRIMVMPLQKRSVAKLIRDCFEQGDNNKGRHTLLCCP